MKIAFSIPDAIAQRFRAAVPPRRRSHVVARLIAEELEKQDQKLAAACRAANEDSALEHEIDEWQGFDDEFQE